MFKWFDYTLFSRFGKLITYIFIKKKNTEQNRNNPRNFVILTSLYKNKFTHQWNKHFSSSIEILFYHNKNEREIIIKKKHNLLYLHRWKSKTDIKKLSGSVYFFPRIFSVRLWSFENFTFSSCLHPTGFSWFSNKKLWRNK